MRFSLSFATNDGVVRQETGSVRQLGAEEATEISGQVQWVSPEGQLIQLSYVANENGFQPVGDHLPKLPPLHPAIQRALELQERNRQRQQQQG